jgi:hypothetical protein
MPQDQPGSDEPTPQRSSSFLEDPQTRRLFLKAAVISGAAVATVGAAGVAAANASPQILRQLRGEPATMSGGGCGELKEASKDNTDGPVNFLEVTTATWATLSAGALGEFPCILVTDKNDSSHTLLTTVTCHQPKGSHILIGICPPIPKASGNTFPEKSPVCIATGCPPETDCGTSPCS